MASLWPHGAFNDHRGHPYMTSPSSRMARWQSTCKQNVDNETIAFESSEIAGGLTDKMLVAIHKCVLKQE